GGSRLAAARTAERRELAPRNDGQASSTTPDSNRKWAQCGSGESQARFRRRAIKNTFICRITLNPFFRPGVLLVKTTVKGRRTHEHFRCRGQGVARPHQPADDGLQGRPY